MPALDQAASAQGHQAALERPRRLGARLGDEELVFNDEAALAVDIERRLEGLHYVGLYGHMGLRSNEGGDFAKGVVTQALTKVAA
jgi:hypothetical protein